MDATTRDGTAETGHHGAGKQAPPAIALTIAGSDSGGGAGIQADLKAFSALGVYGASVITAITAQNTRAVTHIHDIPLDVVAGQIAAVLDDLDVAAVKIGMLSSPEIVETVAGALGGYRGPVVLDPVMVAKSGAALLRPEAVAAVRDILVPRATLMTPNLPEAALLLGEKAATNLAAAERQGRALAALGPAVLMKGGHAQGVVCTDLLIAGDLPSLKLKARRLETKKHPWHRLHPVGGDRCGAGERRRSPAGRARCPCLSAWRDFLRRRAAGGVGPWPGASLLSPVGARMTQVSVIGAGVIGLACATAMTEAGHDVTVYDRGEGPGPASCSWWAGGMLAPWCEGESAEEPVERLGAEALDWWAERVDGVARNGSLVVAPARDASDLRRFERRTRNAEKIDAERVAELEPDLAGRFRQALFFAGEGHLDPRAALAGLRQRLAEAGTRGVFMVGATMIESDERDRISARAMMELLGGAYALHPAFAEAEILEIGVDVRPRRALFPILPPNRSFSMSIIVNGEPHDLAPVSLAALLTDLGYGDAIVATALNGDFVPAEARGETAVADGDRVEILAPMQGG
eukprot:jgi/Tetstr1/433726/TSEL_022945.t1